MLFSLKGLILTGKGNCDPLFVYIHIESAFK